MNLRAFLVLFYVTSFIFVTTPERRRLRELAKTDPQECSRIAHLQVKKAFRNMLRIAGVKIEVSGLDNIPDEPCLYVANHNSYVDILVTETVIPTGAGFVSKDSLQKIPGLSSWMYLIHCLFLNRTDVREGLKMITTGADYLKEGYSMLMSFGFFAVGFVVIALVGRHHKKNTITYEIVDIIGGGAESV